MRALTVLILSLSLVLGAGAAVASAQEGSAAGIQYVPTPPVHFPDNASGGVSAGPGPGGDSGYIAHGSGGLPFTGYAAIPVAGVGLLLLGTGVALRRRRSVRPLQTP